MRSPLVVGNWKMNGTRESARNLLDALIQGFDSRAQAGMGVCVPYVFIPAAADQLKGTDILLGSENVADQDVGAFTGEISAAMIKEFGCELAIVGHSERRHLYGESNKLVAARYRQAQAQGILPIFCVGETLEQREHNQTFVIIDAQLAQLFDESGAASLRNAVIAYEPVWAIGTGKTATPEQAQKVHAYIRKQIASHDPGLAEEVRILYGGSVKPDNAAELFGMPDIDGGLIGGASLDARAFLSICSSAEVAG